MNKKNIIIIVLSLLLVVALSIIIILIMNNQNRIHEIEGQVIITDSNYILISSDEEDYIINNISNKYEMDDVVKITYKEKDIDRKNSPKSIKAKSDKLIHHSTKQEESSSEKTETSKPSKVETPTVTTTPIESTSNTGSQPSADKDEEVLNYVDDMKKEFDAGTIKDSLKSGFISAVDFLFYDGKIKGHTFSELTDSAKLKVLGVALYFDGKIDKYFPGYKESISNTATKVYTNIKERVVKTYLEVTTRVCDSNAEACRDAKESFGELKTNFGLSWQLIKEISKDGVNNLKEWYEIFSGKV